MNQKTFKILIIDDEDMLRHVLKDILVEKGFIVDTASNGQDGLSKIENSNDIDLILLDIQMPGMSGYEVLNRVRRLKLSIKIIILSAYDVRGREQNPKSMQIFDYLHKPVSIERLVSTIQQALGANSFFPRSLKWPN